MVHALVIDIIISQSAFARHVLNRQLSSVALQYPSGAGKLEADVVFNDGKYNLYYNLAFQLTSFQYGRTMETPSVENSKFTKNRLMLTMRSKRGGTVQGPLRSRWATVWIFFSSAAAKHANV